MLICIVGKKLTNNFAEKTAEKRRAKFDAYLKVMSKIIYPYRMKIYTEFNLATWLRLVKFTELNISEF